MHNLETIKYCFRMWQKKSTKTKDCCYYLLNIVLRSNVVSTTVLKRPVTVIRWTPDEWRTVAKALMAVRPEYSARLPPTVYRFDLTKAIESLPEDRRRSMPGNGATTSFRAGLNQAYKEILSAPPPPAPVPVVAVKPASKKKKAARKASVFWKPAEYLALATELHRAEPSAGYLASTTLAGLSPAALRAAEARALPEDRRRHLVTVTAVRAPLLEAFKELKAVQVAEETALEAKRRDIAEHPERYGMPRPVVAPPPNPYEVVFKPLVEFFMNEFMARMAQQYPPPPVQQKAHTPMAQAQIAPEPVSFKPPAKIKIGIVGAMSVQAQDIAREFPQFEILHQENASSSAVNEMRGAAKVIGTRFMPHSPDGALAKHFGDKYARIHGGVSAIKRQIKVWIASGALA